MKLTKSKTKWVSTFKPNVLKGLPLHHNASIADKYHTKLDKLIQQMTDDTVKAIKKLYKTDTVKDYFAEDASIASQGRILMNTLSDKFNNLFAQLSDPYANQMVNNADKQSKSSLFQSLDKITGGLGIKTNVMSSDLSDVIKASVTENVNLIKSIPQQYFTNITGQVMRSVTSGRGLADLMPFIESHNGMTKRRAKTIAYDQSRKAYNSINAARMDKVGIKKFMWHHSGGGAHPRELHKAMSGHIYRLDKPPVIDERTGERGLPGTAVNCKCYMTPVIEFDEDKKNDDNAEND